jgi:hypothetical protein
VEFPDFNGDGKVDYLVADYNTGSVHGFMNLGGTPGHWNWDDYGQIASGENTPTDPPAIKFGDFNADKKDDYLVLHADGSVEEWQIWVERRAAGVRS